MKDGKTERSQRAGMRILRITALMAGLYIFFHLLPDFAPERPATFLRKATGDPKPELCHFSSLGFTAVNLRRSPVVMRLLADSPPRAGEEVRVTVALSRAGGKPVTFSDLEEQHTEKFHLLVIDPTLQDYHHFHPVPTAVPGEYEFSFTPRHGGSYRLFGEVVPVVTGRALQTVADLDVAGEGPPLSGTLPLEQTIGDYRFIMIPPEEGTRAGRPGIVSFDVRHVAGEAVSLEPVMGAWAHLVAFDAERSGFAHMHPLQEDLEKKLDETKPELDFMFYAEDAGVYTVWAQLKIDGRQLYAPFEIEVL